MSTLSTRAHHSIHLFSVETSGYSLPMVKQKNFVASPMPPPNNKMTTAGTLIRLNWLTSATML